MGLQVRRVNLVESVGVDGHRIDHFLDVEVEERIVEEVVQEVDSFFQLKDRRLEGGAGVDSLLVDAKIQRGDPLGHLEVVDEEVLDASFLRRILEEVQKKSEVI